MEALEARNLLSTLSWANGPSIPTAVGREASLNYGNGVLIVGGSTTATGTTAPTTSRILDVYNDVWTSAPAIDRGRNGGAIGITGQNGPVVNGAFKYSGDIFLYGGSSSGTPTATMVQFDVAQNDFANGPSMHTARYDFAAVTDTATGDLYAIGGLGASNAVLSSVERYDPTLDAWVTLAPLPVAIAKSSASIDGNGDILVFGGTNSAGTPLNTVYEYTIANNSWTSMAPMPYAASGTAAVFGAYGQVYVIGGQTSSGATSAVSIFNPVLNTWTSETPLPTAVFGPTASLDYNGNIDVIGGFNTAGNAVNTVYVAAALPAPTNLPAIPTIQLSSNWSYYNGQPQGVAPTALASDGVTSVDGTFDITYNGSTTPPTNAGIYAVLVHFTSADPNYVSTYYSDSLDIVQATPTVNITGGGTITWDGQPHPISATATGVDGITAAPGVITYTYNGSTTAPTDPGIYTAIATFTSGDPNYVSTTAQTTITIPDYRIPAVTAHGYTTTSSILQWNPVSTATSYTVYKRNVLHSPKGSGVTITWSAVGTTTGTSLVVGSGSYAVKAAGPFGVSAFSNVVGAVFLSPASLYSMLWGGAVTSYASVEVGQTLQVTLLGYGEESPTYTMVSGPSTMSVDPVTGVVTYTPIASEMGTQTATFTATNSLGSGTATFTFKVLGLPTVVVTGGTFQYDGNTHAATAVAYGADGVTPIAGTFYITYTPDVAPTANSTAPYAQAGNFTVNAVFISSDPNYGGATGTGRLYILPSADENVPSYNQVTWNGGSSINSITVQPNGIFILNSPSTIETQSLTLLPGSSMDLNASYLLIHHGSLADVTAAIADGRLTSSVANASGGLIGLAVVDGGTFMAISGPTAAFGGLAVSPTDVLVRLTYRGDANLDGVINVDDYQQIELGYLLGLKGYANGDFNYDGMVNSADYAIIDYSFINQTGPLSAGSGLLAVPATFSAQQSIAVAPAVIAIQPLVAGTLPATQSHGHPTTGLPTPFTDSDDSEPAGKHAPKTIHLVVIQHGQASGNPSVSNSSLISSWIESHSAGQSRNV